MFAPRPNQYALILAGGSGQRFWPWSREKLPKQLLPLFNGRSLLQLTFDRIRAIIPPSRIVVLTGDDQVSATRSALPDLPVDNLIAEPSRRDTAAAIALGLGIIHCRDSKAIVAVLPSDQLILDSETFRSDLQHALSGAELLDEIVLIGIPPTTPSSAYGYVKMGRTISLGHGGEGIFNRVERFVEKPKADLAAVLLEEGDYLWNAGIFVLSGNCFRRQIESCAPWLSELLDQVQRSYGHLSEEVRVAFDRMQRTSFDYAVMEKAKDVLLITARFDWDDLGTWQSYCNQLSADSNGNVVSGLAPVLLDAQRNVVISTTAQRVALLGGADLVVVVTEDAILIAEASQMERLKSLVELLPADLR